MISSLISSEEQQLDLEKKKTTSHFYRVTVSTCYWYKWWQKLTPLIILMCPASFQLLITPGLKQYADILEYFSAKKTGYIFIASYLYRMVTALLQTRMLKTFIFHSQRLLQHQNYTFSIQLLSTSKAFRSYPVQDRTW